MDRRAWWATVHGGHGELDMTEATVCVCVCVCGTSCKWNHAIFVLLCLPYTFKHNSFKVYLQCSNYQTFSPF